MTSTKQYARFEWAAFGGLMALRADRLSVYVKKHMALVAARQTTC